MQTNAEKANIARMMADRIEFEGWFKEPLSGRHIRFPARPDARCYCIVTACPEFNWVGVVDDFARFLGATGDAGDLADFAMAWNDSQPGPEPVYTALREFADYLEGVKNG